MTVGLAKGLVGGTHDRDTSRSAKTALTTILMHGTGTTGIAV